MLTLTTLICGHSYVNLVIMEDEPIKAEIVKVNGNKVKRKYEYSDKVKLLKNFESLTYSKSELSKLGLIRPELKDKAGEIAARFAHELATRLRNDPNSFSHQELVVGLNLTTQRLLDLEKQGLQVENIDWAKFNVEEFEKTNDQNKSETE
jgi:hypothetical protein